VTPRVSARASTRLRVRPAHFVERHGLLLIVALGESVVAIGIGIGLGAVRLDLGLFAVAVLGLALAAGLWWAYFAGDEEGAERALSSAALDRRFRLANDAYFFAFIPMLLGVIVIAAGVKRSIGHAQDPLASDRRSPSPVGSRASWPATWRSGACSGSGRSATAPPRRCWPSARCSSGCGWPRRCSSSASSRSWW